MTRHAVARRELLSLLAGAAAVPGVALSWGCGLDPPANPVATAPLHYESLAGIARLLERREMTSVDLTRQLLDRIASVDGRLQSYVTVMADRAMASAAGADAEIRAGRYRGALHGVPIGVKDLCDMRGVPTLAGTRMMGDVIPDADATVVARLEAAGAVVLGKLVLCEAAFGPYFPGLQVPVNPWNPTRWSGVSSSGSGVATAAGLCFGSIGTDTGGSIRYPSASNGCVGLKPTYGRVSRHGVFGLAASMDHVGPMTRRVEDAAIMLEVMAGFDPGDPSSLREPVPAMRSELNRGIDGLQIGFDRRYATDNVDPAVAQAMDTVLAELTRLGATVVPVTMPDVSMVLDAWFPLCAAEAVVANARTYPSRASEYDPGFRPVLEYGQQVSAATLTTIAATRSAFSSALEQMLMKVDCLVCPSMSNTARAAEADPFAAETDTSWNRLVINDVHTKPFNFSGSPTLSVPCGFSAEGLPLSVQFVGRRLSEALLCRVGHAYEQAAQWYLRHPAV